MEFPSSCCPPSYQLSIGLFLMTLVNPVSQLPEPVTISPLHRSLCSHVPSIQRPSLSRCNQFYQPSIWQPDHSGLRRASTQTPWGQIVKGPSPQKDKLAGWDNCPSNNAGKGRFLCQCYYRTEHGSKQELSSARDGLLSALVTLEPGVLQKTTECSGTLSLHT